MFANLGPLHAIAARQGDGLRPELARFLEGMRTFSPHQER